VVTLTGRVPTLAAKERAGDIVKGVEGVRRVDNRLSVKTALDRDRK
jgi:osmotically-inducible protein OsmY